MILPVDTAQLRDKNHGGRSGKTLFNFHSTQVF